MLETVSWTREALAVALDMFIAIAGPSGPSGPNGPPGSQAVHGTDGPQASVSQWFAETAIALARDPEFTGISAQLLENRIRLELDLYKLLQLAYIVRYETGRELSASDQDEVARVFLAQAPRTASLRYLQINMASFLRGKYPFRRQMAAVSRLLDQGDEMPSIGGLSL